jgi:TPR repeat protein
MAKKHFREGDYETAVEYLTKAAELGYADAHFGLSTFYYEGEVVEKDTKKAIYHLEQAAIAGHPKARHNLGVVEKINGRFERARKHFLIAANLGYHNSLSNLKRLYADGHASKEDYAGALRAYQAAVDATKSSEREKAEKAMMRRVYL